MVAAPKPNFPAFWQFTSRLKSPPVNCGFFSSSFLVAKGTTNFY